MLKLSLRKVLSNILMAAILSLSFVSCDILLQDKIPYTADDNGSLIDLLRTVESGKLQTPQQLYVAPFYSNKEIRLTWGDVKGASYYMVERAVAAPIPGSNPPVWTDPDEGEYVPLDRFVYGTYYNDEIIRTPTLESPEFQNKYYYRVSAYSSANKFEESDPTVPQSAMLFRTPVGLKASGGTSVEFVQLTWEHTDDVVYYEIWRSDLASGVSSSLLDTVTADRNWYENKVTKAEQGKDFYYMVAAVNRFGNRTLQTRPAYGYAKVEGAPDKPGNVRLKSGSGRGHDKDKIEIEWDEVNEADVYYAVFRYSNVDSSLTRLTEKTENTSWSDTSGLKPGIYYFYRVQAIVDNPKLGTLRSEFSSDDPEGFILSAPDTVIAEKKDGGVTVKWMPAMGDETERGQYQYNVYSDSNMNGIFSNSVQSGINSNTDGQGYVSISFTATSGHTFFRVSTVNGAVESEKSVVVSPAPDAAIIKSVSQYALITNVAANSSGVYPVRITWEKPANDAPEFYNIQRSTRSGAGFSRVNETSLSASGPYTDVYFKEGDTTYVYIDKNESARVGRKYYYRVLSLNQLEQGSFPSDERIGWGALTHTQYLIEYNKTMNAALKKLTYMYKPGSTDKLGTETKYGPCLVHTNCTLPIPSTPCGRGSIYYNAALDGLGARIIIRLTNYSEFHIENVPENGIYFTLNGNSNTSANMSSNGSMDGTVTCTGMYPGAVSYDKVQIKGGAAGGGTYGVTPVGFPRVEVDWTVIN